jgi:hypothetical protein
MPGPQAKRRKLPIPALSAMSYRFVAPRWWWRRDHHIICHGATTMLVLGLVVSVFGIGFFCWLTFTLIIHALPFVVGLSAGLAAFHAGAGVIGAPVVGVVVGALTLFMGRIAFASARSLILRAAIALLYAVPAAIAGYHAILGLSQIGMSSLLWREGFAWIGALFIGATAWARIAIFTELPSSRPGGASGESSAPRADARNASGLSRPRHRRGWRRLAEE